jgi:hypothetical protein
MGVNVLKKCITITKEQDQKIRAIQMREMSNSTKAISYSSVMQRAIDLGLKAIQ